MFKYLLALVIIAGAPPVTQAKTVSAKGHYLCLAAKINKRIKELQPIYYGKEKQIEAVYCNSVKGDYIVLKENQGNITVFKDVEKVNDLIVGKTSDREVIVQPETNIYKLDDEYSQFIYSEIATQIKKLVPEAAASKSSKHHGVRNNVVNHSSGHTYAD